MLIIGLVLFGLASLLATLASNPWQLIACRARWASAVRR